MNGEELLSSHFWICVIYIRFFMFARHYSKEEERTRGFIVTKWVLMKRVFLLNLNLGQHFTADNDNMP